MGEKYHLPEDFFGNSLRKRTIIGKRGFVDGLEKQHINIFQRFT